MQYKMLYYHSGAALDRQVNALLAAGWELYGSPVMAFDVGNKTSERFFVGQAMIKPDDIHGRQYP